MPIKKPSFSKVADLDENKALSEAYLRCLALM